MILKNSIDVYRAVLVELNKENSPSFEDFDFTLFINKAINYWIDIKLYEFPNTQQRKDNLRLIIQEDYIIELTNNNAELPNNYRNMLGVFINNVNSESCKDVNTLKGINAYNTDKRGSSNYYHKHTEDRQFYDIRGNKIQIFAGNKSYKDCVIEYIKKPSIVDIDFDNVDSDKNIIDGLFTIDYIAFQIIELCSQMFMENTENPRTERSIQFSNQIFKN